jgi:chloramphenicol-sensitive protein RarD
VEKLDKKAYIKGLAFGVSAYILWGLLPLYWRLVSAISPYQIFGQRVVWSFVFICILLALTKKWPEFLNALKDGREWSRIIIPAVFISLNWIVYIWGVNNGYVIEASLGYFINPLICALFGKLFFNESLTFIQKISIGFAAAGVILKTLMYGRIPYVSLVLAVSFAVYGLFKKKSRLNSVSGLGFETLVIGIPSLIYLLIAETSGAGITGNLPGMFWLLIALSGIITATPLILYAEGMKRLPFTIMGFLQYISPTLQLFLGIYVFKEPFDLSSLAAFSLIWAGVILFTWSQYAELRKRQAADETVVL